MENIKKFENFSTNEGKKINGLKMLSRNQVL